MNQTDEIGDRLFNLIHATIRASSQLPHGEPPTGGHPNDDANQAPGLPPLGGDDRQRAKHDERQHHSDIPDRRQFLIGQRFMEPGPLEIGFDVDGSRPGLRERLRATQLVT